MEEAVVFNEIKDGVQIRVQKIIEGNLAKRQYNSQDAQTWTNIISDSCIKQLTEFNKNFKFIVNCVIMQKTDCGLNMSGSCYWDSQVIYALFNNNILIYQVDGNISITWENNSMVCIVNAFGVGL